jgi:DegV family protein with EDD domain
MSKVGIVTDSTNCLPKEVLQEYDIHVVPVGFTIEGQTYWDTEISSADFWKLFKESKELPSTNAVPPGAFTDIFNELAKTTDSIVCILVSKALSATNSVAVKASEMIKEEHPDLNIEIVDSKTSAGALGFIVMEAAKAAKAGKSLKEVVQVAEEMIPRVKFVCGMNTMKYLIKSGRAPKSAYVGELLQIKPIIGMVSGTGLVESLGRVNGSKKTMPKLTEMVKDYIDTSKPIHLMVHYTDDINTGEDLKGQVTSAYNCSEVHLTPYSPVMAYSTGRVVALSFYS